MRVAVYCRVSTDQQELDHQVEACRRFCEFKGFQIGRIYSEKVSGASTKRLQYLELVKDLRNGLFAGVVVFRLDRLGRNARELALLIDELEGRGIKVLSLNESFDTSTAMGRAMRELVMVFAQLEREQIGEATKQRLAALKAAGKRLGRRPASDFQIKKIRELAATGLSCRRIAGQVRLSVPTISAIVKQKGCYAVPIVKSLVSTG